MTDDPLTPDERAALDALPREATPPAQLEDRVVAALRRSGHLRPSWTPAGWLRVAAAVLLVLAGLILGRLTAPGGPSPAATHLLLLYGGEAPAWEQASRVAEYAAWAAELRDREALVGGERLAPEARLAGTAAAPDIDQPVGFFLVRADSLDSAAGLAASCPHLRHGGQVVVRPIK